MAKSNTAMMKIQLLLSLGVCVIPLLLVGALREPMGVYCADLSASVKFDTEVDQSILISFSEGAKAGARWGRHIS